MYAINQYEHKKVPCLKSSKVKIHDVIFLTEYFACIFLNSIVEEALIVVADVEDTLLLCCCRH